ncbi:MAG TPA: PIN domain-containing protein [Thermoanaerobaculia bacterium]|nr:PIN domain-containing protein [Thermoanaerobaculia bacterium]
MRFVDTNVLLYAASTDPRETKKARTALALLDATDLALSVQVLQEFFVQATRASRADRLSHAQAAGLVEAFLRFPVQDMTPALMRDAIAICERHRLSYWDAAILAGARALGCDVVLSEDLAHGRSYDGVRVENPFRARA